MPLPPKYPHRFTCPQCNWKGPVQKSDVLLLIKKIYKEVFIMGNLKKFIGEYAYNIIQNFAVDCGNHAHS